MAGLLGLQLAAFSALGPGPAAAATPVVTQFNTGAFAASTTSLDSVTAGPDGKTWFTESGPDKIGRINSAGGVTEYSLPSGTDPTGIAAGPDGNLWFTEQGTDGIGKITTSGVVTQPVASTSAFPAYITPGPDGNLWFTEFGADRIDKITTGGTVTAYPLAPGADPGGITAGPDGALWFAEFGANKIGRITTAGAITEPGTLGPLARPKGITVGPDGKLWFTESGGKIGKISTGGALTEYPLASSAEPGMIAAGPDGNLWFTDENANKVGRISVAGAVKEFGGLTPGARPFGIAAGADANLWFTEEAVGKMGTINTSLDQPDFHRFTRIRIPGSGTIGKGEPYPSEITVSGLQPGIRGVIVRLIGISHTFPDDINALLVGPHGQRVMLASDVGGGTGGVGDGVPVNGVTLTFAKLFTSPLPDGGPLVSGIFLPTDYAPADTFSSPAPAGPYGTLLSTFDGTDPNGSWKLFVQDDFSGDAGVAWGGWGMDISTPPPSTGFGAAMIKPGKHRASFHFSATPGMTFLCKLDKRHFSHCRSPKVYRHLSEGKHTFRVKARDALGKADPTPAKRRFRI